MAGRGEKKISGGGGIKRGGKEGEDEQHTESTGLLHHGVSVEAHSINKCNDPLLK